MLAQRREIITEPSTPLPFNSRTEVSADAHYIAGRIIKHLWIILVILPFILAILYVILKSV